MLAGSALRVRQCREGISNGGSQRVGRGERVQLFVQPDVRSVDTDPRAKDLFDPRFRLHLSNWHSQGRLSVDNGVFSKQDDLARCRSFDHEK